MPDTYIMYEYISSQNRTQHTNGMCDLAYMDAKDRLKTAREKAGFKSASEAARLLRSININTLISNENGNRPISKKMAQVYAESFNVSPGWLLYGDGDQLKPVAGVQNPGTVQTLNIHGEVAAGLWLESNLFEAETIETSTLIGCDSRFPSSAQYLLRIKGESLNKVAQDGDLILCVNYLDALIEIKIGDLAVVERSRDGGHTVERTAKRIVKHNGVVELHPVSTDPRFQNAITYSDLDPEASEVMIKAKIIGVIKQFD
ncbi:LexA family transcriptional regulator [Roseibium algae]|uniref:XRE family transcriptional regulator n=1 Tax=Roseibium algae TaxID=3123038 RepID=A0ABU8TQJ5_9HYPH